MDFNTTGHKQRKGKADGLGGLGWQGCGYGGWGGGVGGGGGGVVLRGVLVRRTESIGIH